MPELPDITAYLSALEPRIVGQPLTHIRIASPFLLRTVQPRIEEIEGHTVRSPPPHRQTHRHRVRQRPLARPSPHDRRPPPLAPHSEPNSAAETTSPPSTSPTALSSSPKPAPSAEPPSTSSPTKPPPKKSTPAAIDVFATDLEAFRTALTAENRTLKRALTDPRILCGIGNAYSDEILHAAHLSPILQTHKLTPDQWQRLFTATRDTLQLWIDRLNAEAAQAFPEKVTAFRKDMAVHGRFGQPCPTCGQPIQRIRYADNETNYCAQCQTNGKVLADRSLSRLLGADWPRTLDELEALKKR